MQSDGPSRLVSLTGTGVRDAGDRITFVDWLLNAGITLVDPERIRDGLECADLIRASGLDWTLLRVLKLTDAAPGSFALTPSGPAKTFVSRREVAQAVLRLLDGESPGRLPIISPN